MDLPLTPLEFARRSRKLHAHREAVIDGDLRFTYGQFLDRCDRWSAALQQMGLEKGDRVALIAPNTHAMLESFYAIPQLGAVVVPINYRLTADDFVYLIEHSGARILCAHSDYLQMIDEIRHRLTGVEVFVAFDGSRTGWVDYEATLASSPLEFRRPHIAESDLISINYTSGTTARPKGVMITHRNAWSNSVTTLVHLPMTPADRYLWTVPMFHVNGWAFVWTVTAAGGTHVCLPKVDVSAIYRLIDEERVSFLCAAPTVLIMLANAANGSERDVKRAVRVITSGAPPAAATIERVERDLGWQITHVYGMTEAGPFISICEPRPEDASLAAQPHADARARQGVEWITSGELRVVTEDGKDVPRDGKTLGEIVARGNAVMKGYYNDPDATEAAFRGGWFHSGDAAVVHPDGYMEVRDRFKDVIISGGENISSIEVEGMLLRHPDVVEAAVVGVADKTWGETPHAFVVLRPHCRADEKALREFCRNHLAHFKVPGRFTMVPELPKTATGKIQKFVLRNNHRAIHKQ